MNRLIYAPLTGLIAVLALSTVAHARVKLVLLPQRENVRLHFEPTAWPLMEEERVVALEEGANEVELAWSGLAIDPASVMFTPLTEPEGLTTLSTAVPPSEQASLVWRVRSDKARNVRLRISYVLGAGGMFERTDYKTIAAVGETEMDLSGSGRINNNSGMDQDDVSLEFADSPPVTLSFDRDERREVALLETVHYPMTKTYTSDSAALDGKVMLKYEWVVPVDRRAQLAGKARAFLAAGEADAMDTFLGEDFLPYVPSGEKAILFVGMANDMDVERKLITSETVKEWFTKNVSPVQRVMHDQKEQYQITIENHRPAPVTIKVVEHHGGDWEIVESTHEAVRKDAMTFEFAVEVPENGEVQLMYVLLERYVQDM